MAADAQSSQSDERLTSLSRSARFAAVDARQAITPVTVSARPRLSVARMVMLTSVMTLARSLGVERAVIFHVDDVGMCHAQIERARSAGIRPTQSDAHMAAAMLPELLDCHVRPGRDYGLVPVLPRSIRFALDPRSYDATVAALERAGLPVVDHIRAAPCRPPPKPSSPTTARSSKSFPRALRISPCTAPRRATSRASRRSTRRGRPTNMRSSHRVLSPSGVRRSASRRSATATSNACGFEIDSLAKPR
jgi:hypothetical protein